MNVILSEVNFLFFVFNSEHFSSEIRVGGTGINSKFQPHFVSVNGAAGATG